ncbi:MAG: ABC-2 family transporter protein [bacterium]|nr:ABC-2 family transporter protein [bacterium]
MKLTAVKLKKCVKIWRLSLYNSLMQRMAYRFNFLLMCVGVFLQMILTLIFINVIFGFIDNLSGWTREQALIVVASYMIIEGLMWATCAYLAGISRNIRMGTMDLILIKPMDAQYLVSIWRGDPEDWVRVATALLVFIYAIVNLDIPLAVVLKNLIYYIILMFNAYVIVYSITLILKSFSFWFVEATSLNLFNQAVTRMSQYPTDIFAHKIAKIIFSTVIPLAFIATVPAKILIGGMNLYLFFSSCALAIIFFYSSRKFWLFALKHYSSASS